MRVNTRVVAAKIVDQSIFGRRPLDQVLEASDWSSFKDSDKNFIYHICTGTVRWYFRLLPILNQLLHKPLDKKHHEVLSVLLTGIYQLIYMQTPEYAAISETVNVLKIIKKDWATGLVNKILRLFCATKEKLLHKVDLEENQKYGHPIWLTHSIQKDWPTEWKNILEANNHVAPMTLRINPQFCTADHYLILLHQNNISAKCLAHLPFAIQLERPIRVNQLPGFQQGWVYVQDEAGQYSASLLQLAPGLTVLDACAAPGSKTTDLLLTEPKLKKLIAVDKDSKRLAQIQQNIERLHIHLIISPEHIRLIAADVTDTQQWWSGDLFDRILIDAPCSATGIIRRHPDIKILRKPEDITEQAKQQYQLLATLWPLLKQNGLLLYATCSILKEENTKNILKFLKEHKNSELEYEQQLFPTLNGHDGFYYALIKKSQI